MRKQVVGLCLVLTVRRSLRRMSLSASSPPPRLISDELWALFEPLIPPQPPAVHRRTGRPRVSDRDVLERYLRRRSITARIARIGRDSSTRLGRHRWVIERTLGWLLSYERLALRYDRTATTITALARLAVTLICPRHLPTNRHRRRGRRAGCL